MEKTNIKNKTLDEMFDHVWEDYMVRLCVTEVEIYKSRLLRMDNPIQIYFNSSPLKNVFARVMAISRIKKKPQTITKLASQLLVSRQAISTIVRECLEKDWIELVERRGREKTYYATETLVYAVNNYISFVYDLNNRNLYNAHGVVKDLQNLHPEYTFESKTN